MLGAVSICGTKGEGLRAIDCESKALSRAFRDSNTHNGGMHRGLMQAQSQPYIPDKRMSEYQYYEFQTADRRLTGKEIKRFGS